MRVQYERGYRAVGVCIDELTWCLYLEGTYMIIRRDVGDTHQSVYLPACIYTTRKSSISSDRWLVQPIKWLFLSLSHPLYLFNKRFSGSHHIITFYHALYNGQRSAQPHFRFEIVDQVRPYLLPMRKWQD
jgi:hypothetical protein